MRKYFYALITLIIVSCNQSPSQVEKDYIKNLEEKNRIMKKELKEIKSKTDPINAQGIKNNPASSKDYFTIGSTVDEVLEIMGDPTTYIDFGSLGKRLHYGTSTIFFEKGKVESYNNVEGNLKVKVKK